VSNQTTTHTSSSQHSESQLKLQQLPPEPSDDRDISNISKLVIRLPGSFFVIIRLKHIYSEKWIRM
jgi:hypothetical protein